MENTFKDLVKSSTDGVDVYTCSNDEILRVVDLFDNLSLKAKTLHDWRSIGMVCFYHRSKTKEYKADGTSFAIECRNTFEGINDDQRSNSIYLYENFSNVLNWWGTDGQTMKNVRSVCSGYRAYLTKDKADKKQALELKKQIDSGMTPEEIKTRQEQDKKIADNDSANKKSDSETIKAVNTLKDRLTKCLTDYQDYNDLISDKSDHESIASILDNFSTVVSDKVNSMDSESGSRDSMAHVREDIQQVA